MDGLPPPFSCAALASQAHDGELLGYLQHRLHDPHAAADVLDDVFVKSLRQKQGFCTLDSPRACLFQVARNAQVDRARTLRPQESLAPELADCLVAEAEPVAPDDALSDSLPAHWPDLRRPIQTSCARAICGESTTLLRRPKRPRPAGGQVTRATSPPAPCAIAWCRSARPTSIRKGGSLGTSPGGRRRPEKSPGRPYEADRTPALTGINRSTCPAVHLLAVASMPAMRRLRI